MVKGVSYQFFDPVILADLGKSICSCYSGSSLDLVHMHIWCCSCDESDPFLDVRETASHEATGKEPAIYNRRHNKSIAVVVMDMVNILD